MAKRYGPPGITNKQAKYLASLQRALGEPYTGNGMTRREASEAISERLARIDSLDRALDERLARD